MSLAGKKVVVVGGSSGIGLATAELARQEGADVVVASRNAQRLKAAADNIGATDIAADVTSDESVVDLFRKCGPVDHVVVRSCARGLSRRWPWMTFARPWKANFGAPGVLRVRPTSVPGVRSRL